ncbi:glycosyltransferase family 2 protein [Lacihabitans soyangensis]|uniref:Glycosyltransferase n=1 Tax=Lacihabitans soyangensis TaxID=869394 RepID=A0AAE3KUM3_9BACT|nr:glycosyltransferase [Lacihabitans soyangensis]MCP9763356.1 glycosyltransferase [Lacihabitans soyangensis]
MQKQKPLVSVHLLTYNHAKFIAQSIESVVNQKTTFPFEIVIGDDHSTDGTSQIVDQYAAKYPELIKVVRGKTNGGPQPNSIRILENSQGKYMAALEGDDYWIDPLKLQKQADFMEQNPDFAICFTNTRVEFFENNEEPYLLNASIEKDVFELKDLIAETEVWFMGTATLFYTMSSIFPVQPWFHKTKSGDIPMIMLAARHGKIKYLPDVTAAYRRHSAGASNTDHKDDAVFLENRIMMYTNLDRDTGYKFHDKFKRNLGGWYYLLLNSRQYRGLYFKKLRITTKYISLMYPNIPHLKLVLRDHIIPEWIMEITRKIRRALGMIN